MRFSQIDVFAGAAFRGNPVAVVHDADELSDAQMAQFANWTNLSETTFLLRPTVAGADYRLRIFTPTEELPFAGHPTLGSARAWLDAGAVPATGGVVVQECGAGLVPIRRDPLAGERLAFAAPVLIRSGTPDDTTLDHALRTLGLGAADVLHASWIDNGPGWLGLMLRDAATVLELRPDFAALGALAVGVIGAYAGGEGLAEPESTADYEVRAFAPGLGVEEDPVTGSLNAGFGVWLIGAGLAPSSYTVSQGTVLGRAGRVHITADDGQVWVGGAAQPRITGTVTF